MCKEHCFAPILRNDFCRKPLNWHCKNPYESRSHQNQPNQERFFFTCPGTSGAKPPGHRPAGGCNDCADCINSSRDHRMAMPGEINTGGGLSRMRPDTGDGTVRPGALESRNRFARICTHIFWRRDFPGRRQHPAGQASTKNR